MALRKSCQRGRDMALIFNCNMRGGAETFLQYDWAVGLGREMLGAVIWIFRYSDRSMIIIPPLINIYIAP